MITRFADRIVNQMLECNSISEEDAEIISFGIVQGIRTALEIVAILMSDLLFGVFWQGVILLSCYIPVRIYSGGYHARTPLICFLKSWSLFIFVSLFASHINIHEFVLLGMYIGGGFFLWIFSPVQHVNRPLCETEVTKYRLRSHILYLIEGAIALITYLLSLYEVTTCVVVGGVTAVLTMLVAVVINYITKDASSAISVRRSKHRA